MYVFTFKIQTNYLEVKRPGILVIIFFFFFFLVNFGTWKINEVWKTLVFLCASYNFGHHITFKGILFLFIKCRQQNKSIKIGKGMTFSSVI